MIKFITFQLAVLVLLFGCNPDSNVTSPESVVKPQSKLVQLPAPKTLSIETVYTESKVIDGSIGGYFTEQFTYQSSVGTVTITSKLVFPANSFSGSKTFTQTFNTETASLEFGPSMNFNKSVEYTLTICGIDLSTINPNTLDFAYVSPDGSLTGVIYDSVNMDAATNSIIVTNAQLNHFSRYGFINSIVIFS